MVLFVIQNREGDYLSRHPVTGKVHWKSTPGFAITFESETEAETYALACIDQDDGAKVEVFEPPWGKSAGGGEVS